MSKVPMIFGMMLDNPDHEWILWTDDDTYINAGWLDLPLEIFLHDVPEDKLVVLANYRSAFTNAFFIRNSPAGRELAMDWLAVAASGYIQCHGFDQVSAAVASLPVPVPAAPVCLSSIAFSVGSFGNSHLDSNERWSGHANIGPFQSHVYQFSLV
jgi:hypothetical protein